mmetsp:Transcript_67605/g.140923  ORF Transcript_67605/g.140923 Transcript_67605/m.140923 type:complete len:312 (+) Transcript_67605:77-1012(+)
MSLPPRLLPPQHCMLLHACLLKRLRACSSVCVLASTHANASDNHLPSFPSSIPNLPGAASLRRLLLVRHEQHSRVSIRSPRRFSCFNVEGGEDGERGRAGGYAPRVSVLTDGGVAAAAAQVSTARWRARSTGHHATAPTVTGHRPAHPSSPAVLAEQDLTHELRFKVAAEPAHRLPLGLHCCECCHCRVHALCSLLLHHHPRSRCRRDRALRVPSSNKLHHTHAPRLLSRLQPPRGGGTPVRNRRRRRRRTFCPRSTLAFWRDSGGAQVRSNHAEPLQPIRGRRIALLGTTPCSQEGADSIFAHEGMGVRH